MKGSAIRHPLPLPNSPFSLLPPFRSTFWPMPIFPLPIRPLCPFSFFGSDFRLHFKFKFHQICSPRLHLAVKFDSQMKIRTMLILLSFILAINASIKLVHERHKNKLFAKKTADFYAPIWVHKFNEFNEHFYFFIDHNKLHKIEKAALERALAESFSSIFLEKDWDYCFAEGQSVNLEKAMEKCFEEVKISTENALALENAGDEQRPIPALMVNDGASNGRMPIFATDLAIGQNVEQHLYFIFNLEIWHLNNAKVRAFFAHRKKNKKLGTKEEEEKRKKENEKKRRNENWEGGKELKRSRMGGIEEEGEMAKKEEETISEINLVDLGDAHSRPAGESWSSRRNFRIPNKIFVEKVEEEHSVELGVEFRNMPEFNPVIDAFIRLGHFKR